MRTLNLIGAGAILLTLSMGSVFAAGESSDGNTETADKCTGGKVWDEAKQKCVNPVKSELDLDTIYEGGRSLAMAGRYGEAITVLSTVAASGDPRVLNYLGYSHRKQGRIQVGLGYYEEALRINPDFTLAREYMGEAYLQLGNVAAAKAQLQEIASRCGAACDEYLELDRQIVDYMKET